MHETTSPLPSGRRAGIGRAITEDLRGRIRSGEYRPGMALPGRRALASRYGAALPTVERAIATLVAEGLLRAEDRRGTFVAEFRDGVRGAEGLVRGATVGVVGTLHARDEGAGNHRLWGDTITGAIERTVTGEGGRLRFVDRWSEGGELRPLPPILDQFRREGVASVALVGDVEPPSETVPLLRDAGLPFVLVGAGIRAPAANAVLCDGRASGHLAASHLLALGCRKLVFAAPFLADWIEERIEGVRQAVADAGLPASALRLVPREPEPYARLVDRTRQIYRMPGLALGREILAGRGRPAIVTVNDLTAFGILEAARELGKVAGRDFALIGFDDDPRARFEDLSTLRPPLEAMGREAGRLLLAMAGGGGVPAQVHLQPDLLPRGSTRGFVP